MMWQETPFTIPLMIVSVISLILGAYIWWRFRRSWAIVGALLILASGEWMLTYALELGSSTLSAKIFWAKMQFVGRVIVPTAWMTYMLHYTGHEKWLSRRILALLFIVPVATLLLAFTNEYHDLIWKNLTLVTDGPFSALYRSYGIWYLLFIGHSYTLILRGVSPLVRMFFRSRHLFRWQTGALLLGSFAPWIGNMLDVSGLNPFPYVRLTPLCFPVTSLAVAFSILYLRLGDIMPIAREVIIEDMSDAIIVVDSENRIVDMNPSAQNLIGYPASKLVGHPIEQAWRDWSDQVGSADDNMEVKKEISLNLKDGVHIYDMVASPITDWLGNLVSRTIVLRDITERKQAEALIQESEEKFRTIFEHANDVVVYVDSSGKVVNVNEKVEDIFGYNRDEIMGKNFSEIDIFDPKDIERVIGLYKDVVVDGKPMPAPLMGLELKHKNGNKIFVEVNTRLIEKNGKIEGVLSIVRDVTERKQAEEEVKASLEEKEVLLREIHHRVKNNLQVISSLLSLQSEYIKDDQYAKMLKESQNRIRSMALIHEKLYQSETFTNIDFSGYVETLVYGLARSYGVSGNIAIKIEAEDAFLDIDTAIPCGLIINELVSNSLKHAFPDRKGEITVALRSLDGSIELRVSDTGAGIPEDIDFRNTETLGLRLVTILAEDQLGGDIALRRTTGTEFRITFKEQI